MKSAWELALERSGGALQELSAEKKEKIAELERIYKAKIAEARLSADNKMKKLEDPEQIRELQEGLTNEVISLEHTLERKKNEIRNA